jgi:hypothetical protein
MKRSKGLQHNPNLAIAVALGVLASADAFAHTNVPAKDFYLTTDGRSYVEGTSSEFKLNLAHSCSADLPTVVTTIAIPNGGDAEIYTLGYSTATQSVTGNPNLSPKSTKYHAAADFLYTVDAVGNSYAGNALMGIKPSVDNNWEHIIPKKGDVPTFYNHGANPKDVLGIQWDGGNIPNDFYYDLKFRGSLPSIKPSSCVVKVRVYLPAIQYCGTSMNSLTKQDNWLPKPGAGLTDVTTNYAPYFDIDRNLRTNPLPESCATKGSVGFKGEVVGLYPSETQLAAYLLQGGSAGGIDLSKITNEAACTAAGGTWMSHDGGKTFMCM